MKTELYSIIKSPYLTEKVSTLMGESNQYAFKVDHQYMPPAKAVPVLLPNGKTI